MSDSSPQKPGDFKLADPVQLAQNMAKVFEHAAQIARHIAERLSWQKTGGNPLRPIDE